MNAALVEKRLAGRTLQEEDEILEDNPEAFREVLREMLKVVEIELINAKKESLRIGNRPAYVTFQEKKAALIIRKQQIVRELQDVKARLHEENRSSEDNHGRTLQFILEELKGLRADFDDWQRRTI